MQLNTHICSDMWLYSNTACRWRRAYMPTSDWTQNCSCEYAQVYHYVTSLRNCMSLDLNICANMTVFKINTHMWMCSFIFQYSPQRLPLNQDAFSKLGKIRSNGMVPVSMERPAVTGLMWHQVLLTAIGRNETEISSLIRTQHGRGAGKTWSEQDL